MGAGTVAEMLDLGGRKGIGSRYPERLVVSWGIRCDEVWNDVRRENMKAPG